MRTVFIVFSIHSYGRDLAGVMEVFETEDAALAFVARVQAGDIDHPAHDPEHGFGFTFEVYEYPVYATGEAGWKAHMEDAA
jgi:hypothetical protein